MFLAHAPAGYIAATLLYPRFVRARPSRRAFCWAGVIGAIAPDFDMLYFHFVDHRAHSHHSYVTHYPILWLGMLSLALIWLRLASRRERAALAVIFALNGFVHMVLDTVVGGIWWLAPWVDRPYALDRVPSRFPLWWLNFLLHWSFAVELALIAWAWYLSPLPKPGYLEIIINRWFPHPRKIRRFRRSRPPLTGSEPVGGGSNDADDRSPSAPIEHRRT